jgi:hypothetical protein
MLYFEDEAALANEYEHLYNSLFNNAEGHMKVVEAIAKKSRGLSREEIVAATKLTGGSLTAILNALEYCGFIRTYKAFGKRQRNKSYQLMDPFSLFHLKFKDKKGLFAENFWTQFGATPAHASWSGYAFEQVCLYHVDMIKRKLGISGILSEVSSWRSSSKPNNRQIDMVIDRADKIINLCEIKYSNRKFTITKAYDNLLRSREAAFAEETKTKKALQTIFITTYGVTNNEYAGMYGTEVMLDDLF